MRTLTILADAYFDGTRHHRDGPFTIEIADGVIQGVFHGDVSLALAARNRHLHGEWTPIVRAPFVMPGLVEAHCHLFLNGGELDFLTRKNYLRAPRDQMLEMGRQSLQQNLEAGVTLIRDAGDLHGINTQLKAELGLRPGVVPELVSAGRGIRKAARYGGFLAVAVTDAQSIVRTIQQLAATSDQLKIVLTDIIDFETCRMKGAVQFDLAEAKLIVRTARELGLRTLAHCSGLDGLTIAAQAGVDSIEHGFFMTRDILQQMADEGIVWVPTFSPVYFQFLRPELCGWGTETIAGLQRILAQHFLTVALANQMGVPIIAGSDAGSYGVQHGGGLIDELVFHRRAGISAENVLTSATSTPRKHWGLPSADIAPGNRASLIVLDGSPIQQIENLRPPRMIIQGVNCHPPTPLACAPAKAPELDRWHPIPQPDTNGDIRFSPPVERGAGPSGIRN